MIARGLSLGGLTVALVFGAVVLVGGPAAEAQSSNGALGDPPQRGACVTREERSRALAGGACDCSCSARAESWTSRCDLVCGVEWYVCRAPRPTDQAVRDRYMKGFAAYTPGDMQLIQESLNEMLSDPMALEEIRNGQLMEDGLAWDTARACPKR
ncbi:MAG: hypothetical protein R3C52_10740 [Hyphomonadaceae bacterium]